MQTTVTRDVKGSFIPDIPIGQVERSDCRASVDLPPTSNLDPESLWQQAYELVETEKQKITGFARRFLPYSSYSLDEFIQQAYESTYRAIEKSFEKGEPDRREGYFWMQYLKDCYKMANIPSRKKFYEECIKTSVKDQSLAEEILKELSCSPIIHEEYREYSEDDAPATAVASSIPDPLQTAIQNEETLDNELKELIQNEMVKKALLLLTPREKLVWEYLLGHHDGRIYSVQELISVLGLKKSRILALRDNGLEFIQKIFSEQNRLYTLQELSEKSGYSLSTLRAMKRYGFLKAKEDYIQRTKNSSALFTEKALNKLIARREGKIPEETLTIEEIKKSKRVKRQKLYTLQKLSERTGYSIGTLRSMRCYGFFESGREVIKISGSTAGVALPSSRGDLAVYRASGEATRAKKITGADKVFYLFTEKAVKKLILRRQTALRATKNKHIESSLLYPKSVFFKFEGINTDRFLPKAKYETTDAFIVPAHISPTPSISMGVPV